MMQLRPNAAKYIFFKKRERLKKKKSQGKSSREEETEKAKGEEVDYGRKTGPQASSGTPESSTVHHWSTPWTLPSHSYTPGLSERSSISKANIAPGWLLTFPFRDAW